MFELYNTSLLEKVSHFNFDNLTGQIRWKSAKETGKAIKIFKVIQNFVLPRPCMQNFDITVNKGLTG